MYGLAVQLSKQVWMWKWRWFGVSLWQCCALLLLSLFLWQSFGHTVMMNRYFLFFSLFIYLFVRYLFWSAINVSELFNNKNQLQILYTVYFSFALEETVSGKVTLHTGQSLRRRRRYRQIWQKETHNQHHFTIPN